MAHAQVPYALPTSKPDSSKHRFSFGYRVGLNIGVSFENVGGFSPLTMSKITPDGAAYNYDNGYVLPDISGSGVDTWYWGYESTGADPNVVSLNRASAEPVESAFHDVRESPEIAYWRSVGLAGNGHWGWMGAFSFTHIENRRRGPFNTSGRQRTDNYAVPAPPPPAPPYFGTFDGPVPGGPSRPLLSLTPSSSSSTPTAALFTGTHSYEAQLFGLKLGPFIVVPLGERVSLDMSGGLALGLVNSDYDFDETVALPPVGTVSSRGSSSQSELLVGAFASIDLWYMMAEDVGAFIGVQYQYLGESTHETRGKNVTLDLGASFFLSFGIGYSF